jgi:GNAT superfamily N-acetyltransferase
MELKIVNSRPKYRPVRLADPPPLGYLHIAAAVEPPAGRAPLPGSSAQKAALLSRLTALTGELQDIDEVVRATVYTAVVVPPPSGYAKPAGHPARYDVAVLVETTSPETIAAAQGSGPCKETRDVLHEASADQRPGLLHAHSPSLEGQQLAAGPGSCPRARRRHFSGEERMASYLRSGPGTARRYCGPSRTCSGPSSLLGNPLPSLGVTVDVEIRRAALGDLAHVVRLLVQLAPDWSSSGPVAAVTSREEDVWKDILSQDQRIVLVADARGPLVGIADLVLVTSLLDGAVPHAVLDNLVVDKDVRGNGIGRSLIAAAGAVARNLGCCRLELLSSKGLDQAHAFYRAVGFKPTAEGFRQDLTELSRDLRTPPGRP